MWIMIINLKFGIIKQYFIKIVILDHKIIYQFLFHFIINVNHLQCMQLFRGESHYIVV